jgi:hypothetical protein
MSKFFYPIIKRCPSRFHSRVQMTKMLRVVMQSISFVAAWTLRSANRELPVTTAEFAVPDQGSHFTLKVNNLCIN